MVILYLEESYSLENKIIQRVDGLYTLNSLKTSEEVVIYGVRKYGLISLNSRYILSLFFISRCFVFESKWTLSNTGCVINSISSVKNLLGRLFTVQCLPGFCIVLY